METVTKENIHSILLSGESNTVEFKAKVGGAKFALPRIISAFANAEGGVIIIGYDEMRQSAIGASAEEFETVKRIITDNQLWNICDLYVVPYEKMELIIVEVKKSKMLVIAGGGAYIREGETNRAISSKDVVARIASTAETSKPESFNGIMDRLEQMYSEMLRSQEKHDEEIKEQEEKRRIEKKHSIIWGAVFCICSAVIGVVLGHVLERFL